MGIAAHPSQPSRSENCSLKLCSDSSEKRAAIRVEVRRARTSVEVRSQWQNLSRPACRVQWRGHRAGASCHHGRCCLATLRMSEPAMRMRHSRERRVAARDQQGVRHDHPDGWAGAADEPYFSLVH